MFIPVSWVSHWSLFLPRISNKATGGYHGTPWILVPPEYCAPGHHESSWQTQETGSVISKELTQVASWTKSNWLKLNPDRIKMNLTKKRRNWRSDKKPNIVRLVSNFVVNCYFQNPKGMHWWKMHSFTSNSSGNQEPDMKCNSRKYCLKFTQFKVKTYREQTCYHQLEPHKALTLVCVESNQVQPL